MKLFFKLRRIVIIMKINDSHKTRSNKSNNYLKTMKSCLQKIWRKDNFCIATSTMKTTLTASTIGKHRNRYTYINANTLKT